MAARCPRFAPALWALTWAGRWAGGSYREAKGGAFDSFHHKRPAHASQTPKRTCAKIFPDLSQPRCANPNQGHPGRAKLIAINSLVNIS